MNGRLAICVPSRGRPRTLERLVQSWIGLSAGCSDLIVRNGEADPSRDDYREFDSVPNLIRYVGPDDGFNTTWVGTAGYAPAQEDIYRRYPEYSAYLCLEDDTVLHSRRFDAAILAAIAALPGRVGVVKMHDRSQTITCLAISDSWCKALGYLCCPEIGETAFLQTVALASNLMMLHDGHGYAEFTHLPHLRDYGYEGNERPGAMTMPDVVNRFHEQERHLFQEWMPRNGPEAKERLRAAAQCAS